jgi:deoxyribonuclease-4
MTHRFTPRHAANDSKTPRALGGPPWVIGGDTGGKAFRRLMKDPRLARIPKVIETPKLTSATVTDGRMLKLLRGFAR